MPPLVATLRPRRLPPPSAQEQPVARHGATWTGRAASVRVTAQRLLRARISGRPVLENWGEGAGGAPFSAGQLGAGADCAGEEKPGFAELRSSGNATSIHMLVLLASLTGIEMLHVPYRGCGAEGAGPGHRARQRIGRTKALFTPPPQQCIPQPSAGGPLVADCDAAVSRGHRKPGSRRGS